jgi:hypothetical protein
MISRPKKRPNALGPRQWMTFFAVSLRKIRPASLRKIRPARQILLAFPNKDI